MRLLHRHLLNLIGCAIVGIAQADAPAWTFTPLTATSITVPSNGSAIIQYVVTNQSSKPHTLAMTPIQGIAQLSTGGGICASPFTLPSKGSSCVLSLQANGNQLSRSVNGGPIVCEQGSALQCYSPNASDILNISVETVTLTTLSASVSTLALSVDDTASNPALTGTPRIITLTNTGTTAATAVTFSPSPALPSGTTINSTCATLAPFASCTLTVTPGSTPSATPGNTAPTPISLSVSGDNTNTVNVTLNILTHGSVYQSGYVYAVDDTTVNTGSIGGSVVSLADQSFRTPDGVVWSSNGASSISESFDSIPGISETSTSSTPNPSYSDAQTVFNTNYSNEASFPFPSSSDFFACNGKTEGSCNTNNILTFYNNFITNYGVGGSPYTISAGPTNLTYYAAGLCESTIDGYTDWYLPAICEMGPASNGSGCSVATQNMVNNLPNLLGDSMDPSPSTSCAYGENCLVNYYWSSTQYSMAYTSTWVENFSSGGGSSSIDLNKSNRLNVRCARALTQ